VDFDMQVGERLAADGYGWLVGFDYAAQRACPLPDDLQERLALARGPADRP
jgi:acyl-CoA thioester hydrolase